MDKIIKLMKNDYPLIKNLKDYGFYDQLSEEELIYVFSGIFGGPVRYTYGDIFDENGNKIYSERFNGYWYKSEYDERGKLIYQEDSSGVIIDNK